MNSSLDTGPADQPKPSRHKSKDIFSPRAKVQLIV
jgi:hypothetical protein